MSTDCRQYEGGWVSAATIEAGRVAATQYIRGEGRLYVRVFPHKSITSIPLETRMGKGKGEPEFWAAVIRPGTILYELGGVTEAAAKDVPGTPGPQNADPRTNGKETRLMDKAATVGRGNCIMAKVNRTTRHERRATWADAQGSERELVSSAASSSRPSGSTRRANSAATAAGSTNQNNPNAAGKESRRNT